MTNLIKNFAKSESGAVTVDWVVLTAAIVGLGLAVMAVVSDGVGNLSGDIDRQLSGQGVTTAFTAAQTALD
jgi:Flp pilus assembly pilin Flp